MTKKIKIYSLYDRPSHSGLSCKLPSKTQQQYLDECDINRTFARFVKTGKPIPQLAGAFYAALPDEDDLDYRTALERMMDADEAFMQIPASIREVFRNDPLNMLEFLQNPANQDRAYELGLAVRPQPTTKAADAAPVPPQGGTPPSTSST